MQKFLIILAVVVYMVTTSFTGLTNYECLSITLFIYFILSFVDNLGKKLVILDVAIMITIITCLLLPIIGYHYFTSANRLSRLWVNFMRVPADDYYSFMFPATLAMILGMKLPVFYRKSTYKDQEQYMTNVKIYLAKEKWQGLIMVTVGLLASLLTNQAPSSLSFVLFLLSYLMFVGIFYCLYSDIPFKRGILAVVFGASIYRAISGGMFGEMVFISVLTVILVFLGNKMNFGKKLLFLLFGMFSIVILQSVKPSFRKQTWAGKNSGNQLSIFTDILTEKVSNPSNLFNDDQASFLLYSRFNHGQIISNVLHSVPARFPYANGETIVTSLAASVVPRALWTDKPESGGAYNFKRFLGITLKGWSANLSPFGEAWGNFGKIGGIIFMFFFGLLFNFFLYSVLKIAVRHPSLILWFPYLFIYAISIENDVLTMVNSFVKAAAFTYFYYKVFPKVFRLKI